MAPLSAQQQGIICGVSIGLQITLASTLIYAWYRPVMQRTFSESGRFLLWMKWNLPKVACLAIAINRVGNQRIMSPQDIDGAGLSTAPTPRIKMLQAILQNTLEQVVWSTLVHGAYAALAPIEWLGLVPLYTVIFVVGRIMFGLGYHQGAPGRAIGFSLTFFPTLFLMLQCVWWLVQNPW